MNLNKIEIEYIIQDKREEIKKLGKKIDSLQKEIQQIEKENLVTLRGPIENNDKLMKITQLFKKQPRKEVAKPRFKYQELLELDLKKLKILGE